MESKVTSTLLLVTRAIALVLVTCIQLRGGTEARIIRTATNLNTLNHMVVDNSTGSEFVYIGAVNKLYKLDSNLNIVGHVSTGPIEDSPNCDAPFGNTPRTCMGKSTMPTPNYNKVLVVDSDNRRLLTCGSVQQGTCQLRPLTNISDETKYNTLPEHNLAANDPTSSTVAFIAPGPNQGKVVVSGTTLTSPFIIRRAVPIIAYRKLGGNGNEVLTFAYFDDFDLVGSLLKIKDNGKFENYNITFVEGFNVDAFNFFLTVQRNVLNEMGTLGDIVTKIIRICEDDNNLDSYVEAPLTCGNYNILQAASISKPGSALALQYGITTNDHVLVGAFAESESSTSTVPKSPYSSAICIYSFNQINQNMQENVQKCYQGPGRGSTIVKHILDVNSECVSPKNGNTMSCGSENPTNAFIDGGTSIDDQTVKTYAGLLITSIAITRIEEHTIAFLGTHDGKLKTLVIQRRGFVTREYNEMTIDPQQPILKDMKFDPKEEHLYLMTTNKAFKIQVSECGRHSTCESCVPDSDSRDPYCGWCALESRCKKKSQCDKSGERNFWLPDNPTNCVKITAVDPPRASTSTPTPVTVNVRSLPSGTTSDYYCLFGRVRVAVDNIDSVRLRCAMTPSADQLPPISRDQDHVSVTLEVVSVRTNRTFIEKPFIFYNCSKHSSCTECTAAQWECKWCLYDNKCASEMETCSTRHVSTQPDCPRLDAPSSPILVPVDVSKDITLTGSNLPEPRPGEEGYSCIVSITSPPQRVPARRIDGATIICEPTRYTYMSEEGERIAKVELVWNNNFYIDYSNDVTVTFYKCAVMGTDCSLCISVRDTRPQYGCRWCGNAGCQYNTECSSTPFTLASCPKPSLSMVTPLTGPLQGDTPVNISGSNLGTTFEQIKDGVTVAGEPCRPIGKEYRVARQIICLTSSVTTGKSGPVVVKVNNANATWISDFVYQDPVLEGLTPNTGPIAGGTEITVEGKALDTGRDISARLDSLDCTGIKKSASRITCLTARVPKPVTTRTVRVSFDRHQKMFSSVYDYVDNPNITDIFPTASFLSGGRNLTVIGTAFDIIQKPKIFLFNNASRSEEVDCQKLNVTKLLCPTPNVTNMLSFARRRRAVGDSSLQIGFKMDGVTEVTDVNEYMPWVEASSVRIYRNPVLRPFPDGKMAYTGGALVIEGDGLDLASTPSEADVKIGKEDCEVETLSSTRLVCNPPSERPASGDPPPLVVVTLGNERYELGLLEYQAEAGPLPQYVIIIIGVTGGALVLIIIIILIVYQRKRTQAERQFKRLQAQLDTLESNVRNECKQAFAELQTEVTDLTSDLNVTGIPFWDYKTYTFKVLFPSHTDHPILHSKNDVPKKSAKVGLERFNQLLNSKQFMVTFIRTLELQKNFNVRDKAVVASLVMIVIQDKMEYATEILKALLNDLVDRSVEKRTPKLMLRRTESVVEKFLTNWLSICMYSFLKKHAAGPMFLLYKAIKTQSEKGLVDAITSDARYSLSEEKLLRKKIEPNMLTLNLDVDHEAEMITCRVLDCDTITQAKEKCLDAIYKNTPCSKRPAAYDVDLRWHSGRSGFLPLQDEDVTTELDGGWKRINTLAHYNVPDGASMTISPARDKSDMIRHQHGMVEITSGSPYGGIKPIVTVEGGHQVWHLVKPDDLHNQSRTQKVISEIFLTRLLLTKGTVQQYIDDLFLMILKVDHVLPPAIKYLFDLLDKAARRHNIVDQDVVHTWKSNSLPLRFWVNLIKNPEFVFDIRKSDIVDSCLSVIAQTFMDSCSSSENRLGKDSPSNKLLFARDIPKYKRWVENFYKDVKEKPPISDKEMQEAMIELSMQNTTNFNVPYAVKELYRYALQYNVELLDALDEDSSARKLHLADKFEEITDMMDETPIF